MSTVSRPVAGATRHRTRLGRSIVEVRLAQPAARIFAVHLSAGLSRRGERRRLQEGAALLRAVGTDVDAGRSILAGDFNAIAPGDRCRLGSGSCSGWTAGCGRS